MNQQIEIWEFPCMSRVLVGVQDGASLEKEIEEGTFTRAREEGAKRGIAATLSGTNAESIV
jgi:hypothetical protein